MIYPKLSDGTIDWCVMCKHEGSDFYDLCCECEYSENSDDPPTKYEPKPMTNADRIRSMSDEELAAEMKEEGGCPHDCECPDVMDADCYKCWLDWLKQEEKND